MLGIKHIGYFTLGGVIAIALTSATDYLSIEDEIEQTINSEIASKELPIKKNEAFKEGEILRVMPSLNDAINEEWISDKARFFFDMLKTQRISQPFFKKADVFNKVSWLDSFSEKKKFLQNFLSHKPEQVLLVAGANLDLESAFILKQIANKYSISLISEDYLNSGNN